MSKPPTAEEVLGLYREYRKAAGLTWPPDWENLSRPLTYHQELGKIVAERNFGMVYALWEVCQGPVTREWFEERFAGELETCPECGEWVRVRRGNVSVTWIDGDVILGIDDQFEETHFSHVKMTDPTRNDIERFLLVLGGEGP